ncbi:hypothetical protein MKW94_004013 [Papaver nudicaule]|uniref:Uncharacterized protein n=1 Tax=Papaver nudicaule TaxID=74823 RepID=A0AA41VA95_PAPNU|nr:hypothetical protein [Papaver nudicaule]
MQDKHFKFINCVESFVYKGQQSEWRSCYAKLGYEEKPIHECYNSGLGQKCFGLLNFCLGGLRTSKFHIHPYCQMNSTPDKCIKYYLLDSLSSATTFICFYVCNQGCDANSALCFLQAYPLFTQVVLIFVLVTM